MPSSRKRECRDLARVCWPVFLPLRAQTAVLVTMTGTAPSNACNPAQTLASLGMYPVFFFQGFGTFPTWHRNCILDAGWKHGKKLLV